MCHTKCCKKYSTPDQPLRFATAKANNNQRMLNIHSVYAPEYVRGKVVVVTGKILVEKGVCACFVRMANSTHVCVQAATAGWAWPSPRS
jgi:hypothetical protein